MKPRLQDAKNVKDLHIFFATFLRCVKWLAYLSFMNQTCTEAFATNEPKLKLPIPLRKRLIADRTKLLRSGLNDVVQK